MLGSRKVVERQIGAGALAGAKAAALTEWDRSALSPLGVQRQVKVRIKAGEKNYHP